MIPTPDLIMFGIRAALRLRDQYRRGLADSTLNLALVLPLPDFPAQPGIDSARMFYLGADGSRFQGHFLNEFVDENVTIRAVLNKDAPSDKERDALLRAYNTHFAMVKLQDGTIFSSNGGLQSLTADDVNALLSLRQWREGQDPNPSMLRRMGGTIVNLAVDYLQNVPGVISETSATGQALRGFLEGIESIDFAEADRQEIITGLLSQTLETIRDHPDLLAHGNSRELVKQAASGLVEDIQKVLKNGTQRQKDTVGDWGNLVFRSLLNTAGRLVVEEPNKFLGIPGGSVSEELVQRVGKAVLATVIDDQFVRFERLFTPQALDQLVKASLTAVGHHPEILGNANDGIRNIVSQLATDLSQSTAKLGPDFLLHAARLVIEKTGQNLEVLMPGGVNNPAGNLLIVGLKQTMKELSAPPGAGAKWKLEFSSSEAQQVAQAVIDSVVANPGWVASGAAGANATLGDVTKAVLDTIRSIAPADRISRDTVVAILRSSLRAATQRLEFSVPEQNRMLVSQAIEAVLSPIFAPNADASVKWALLRDEVIRELVRTTMEKLARFGITVAQIQKVRQTVSLIAETIRQGGKFSIEDFAGALDAALA